MKPNQFAALILRLLGIYCLIQSVNTFSTLAFAFSYYTGAPIQNRSQPDELQIIIVAGSFGLRLLIAYVLLTRAESLANRFVPPDVAQISSSAISLEQIQMLAFAVAGIATFADSLPQLSTYALGLSYRPSIFSLRNQLIGGGSFLKAALGLWMFLAPRSFVNFWLSFRNFGTPKSAPS